MDTNAIPPAHPAVVTTSVGPLDPDRLRRAKAAYTTRHVRRQLENSAEGYTLRSGTDVVPTAGDVVLARVGEIGQHLRIEQPNGRKALLFEGDEVLVAYGSRYAPDQFEAEVPGDLGPTNLVAAGGVAGTVRSAHSAMLPATVLHPLGLLADADGVVNLQRCAPFRAHDDALVMRVAGGPPTIAVLGTSMNSGKTTTVASIVRGLTAAGLNVAAGKVTGTGAGGDPGLFSDAGATRVLDFTDFGHASTFELPHDVVRGLLAAVHHELADSAPDAIVLEIADGLLQRETRLLVADPWFSQFVDTVVFAAGEAMGAAAGLGSLRALGLDVVAVGGLLTASPLATREAREAIPVPVLTTEELIDPSRALALLPARAADVTRVEQGSDERVAV